MIFDAVRFLFSGRRLRFAVPLSAAVVLGAPPFSFAADEKKPAVAAALAPAFPTTPRYRELWVPTDQLNAVLKKMPRAVMLTPEQYRTLLRDAENGEKPEDPKLKPPVAAVIRDVAFDGVLTNELARISARYRVESFTDEWTEIPLVLPRAQLAHVEVDAETAIRVAPAAKGKNPIPILLVREKGEHTVVAEFHLPVSRSPAGNAIQLSSPGVAAASLRLTLPDGAKLDSALPFTTGEEDANTARFVLPAEPGQNYEIRWTARNIDSIPDAAIFQTCLYLYSIDSTRVQADLGLVLSSSLAELPNRFQITLPEGVRILSVEGSEVLSWDGIATNSGTGIEVVLVNGERQAADIRILAEADIGADADTDVTVTLPVAEIADVHRASGTMALIGSDDVRVKNITTGPLTVAAPDALEPALRNHPHFVAGFRFPVTTAPPEITLSPVRERFNVQLDTHVSLKREAIHLTRQLTVIPLEGRLFATELELPDGEELMRIDGSEAGFTWNRIEGNRVRLAWQQGLVAGDGDVTLDVMTRRDPEGWFELGEEPQSLAFENAAVAAAEVVSGYVAVNFDDSFRVETVTADGLEPRDGRTTPVTGQLAWFRLSDYQLELNAARRATEIEASVTAYAVPLQSTLEVEGQLDLEIRYTPVSEIVVKLDPAVAETVRWDSPLLAEKRLDKETGEWTLDFHEELGGFQRLRFRMALPFEMEEAEGETEQKNFAVSAPVFSVPAAKRLRGDWIIEANTDTELNFETNGVDAVDSLRVPAVAGYQPRHRIIAAYQYRGDAYDLKIAGTRHAPEDLVTTVIDTLRLDTVVSTDGPDRHQVLLDLRTSGEQFLEVGLPEGAVLWTLTVDGEAVKPVRSETGALRIQLPALQDAGQQSILLKLVYQTPGGEWGGSGRETLEPVRLAGRIPVMRTRWFLHLPEGFDYQKFHSNLREDFEIVDRTLLGQAWEEGMLLPGRSKTAIGGAGFELPPPPPQLVAEFGDMQWDQSAAGGGEVPEVASRFVIRMQNQVQHADEAALRGSQLLADGDSQGAITEFRAALDVLPAAPITRQRFDAYLNQYASASVRLAQQRAEEANYAESRALLTEVLSPGVDPDNVAARELLKRLDDPEYYSPATVDGNLRAINRVEDALKKARAHILIGDYDTAEREYWAVINDDRYNSGARRSLEEVERMRMDYYQNSRNHTRAEFLRKVATGWELPVPVTAAAPQPAAEAEMSELAKTDAVFANVPRKPRAAAPVDNFVEMDSQDTDQIGTVERKLKTIIIPSVEFVDTPLRDALNFLRERARELDSDPDPNLGGVDFILNLGQATTPAPGAPVFDTGPQGNAADTKISLKLSNVPLAEALGYTLKLANLKYKVEPHAVVVLPVSAPDTDLYTTTYIVPPTFLSSAPGGAGGGGAAAADPFAAPATPSNAPNAGSLARQSAKNVLEAYGVNFGPGANATYNPSNGTLIVRNTQEQTDLVGALTESLRSGDGGAPPLGTEMVPRNADAGSIDAMIRSEVGSGTTPLGGSPVTAGIRIPDEPASLVDSESGEEVMIGGSVQATSRALNDLVIEELNIEGKSLSEAIELLEQQAREADPTGSHAAASRIDFNGNGVSDTPITLKLENVPASEALRKLTEVSGTQYRVTASGIVIAAPGRLPPESLDTLVLELPNAAFEKSDGNGGARRLSARHLLTDAGVEFPPGTSAAYNFTTRRLAVKNTPANLEAVRNVFESFLAGAGDAFAAGRGQARQILAAAEALGLKGFEFRHAGLIPLDFELPESGRSYSFSGLYAPEPIGFRYVNWERQLRMAWFWMLVGGLVFWFGAVRRWQRPVAIGILGVIVLTFVPLLISESLLAFCNSLLLGWLTAAALWIVWRLCDRFSRKLGREKSGEDKTAGEAAAATTV